MLSSQAAHDVLDGSAYVLHRVLHRVEVRHLAGATAYGVLQVDLLVAIVMDINA